MQELRGRGLPITGVHVTGTILQECATTLLDLFREQRIDLFDYPPLIADLQALRLVHKSYGFRLESPRRAARMSADDRESAGTRHGDCAFALQLAAWLSRDQRFRMPAGQMKAWNERELLCWP